MDNSSNKIYIFLCLAAILWGAQPVVVKVVLQELSPLLITFYRYVGISMILLIILYITHGRNIFPSARHLPILAVMGVSGITLNNVLQFSGLQYSTVINCTLVSATTPAMTAVMSALAHQEQMNEVQWIGIITSFFGVLFLVAHGSLALITSLSFNFGDILFFCSQACWAIYTLLGRKIMTELSPMFTTAWAGLIGAVLTGVLVLWDGIELTTNLTANGIGSIAYMIFGGGVLAMIWWNRGVKIVGASQTAIFINIMPVVGMLLAVLLLGEHLGWREIVGGLWIFLGVYLTTPGGAHSFHIHPDKTLLSGRR